jgi:hypothetical protein
VCEHVLIDKIAEIYDGQNGQDPKDGPQYLNGAMGAQREYIDTRYDEPNDIDEHSNSKAYEEALTELGLALTLVVPLFCGQIGFC